MRLRVVCGTESSGLAHLSHICISCDFLAGAGRVSSTMARRMESTIHGIRQPVHEALCCYSPRIEKPMRASRLRCCIYPESELTAPCVPVFAEIRFQSAGVCLHAFGGGGRSLPPRQGSEER